MHGTKKLSETLKVLFKIPRKEHQINPADTKIDVIKKALP